MDSEGDLLTFTCVHTFSSRHLTDVSFLELQCESLGFKETGIQSQSSLLNPQEQDHIQKYKFEMSKKCFDNMHSDTKNSISQDFVVLLCKNTVRIHKVLGLRNYHQI